MARLARAFLIVISILFALIGLALLTSDQNVWGGFFLLAALFFWPTVEAKIKGVTGKGWVAPVAGLAAEKEAEKTARLEAKGAAERAAIKAREAKWAQEQAELAMVGWDWMTKPKVSVKSFAVW